MGVGAVVTLDRSAITAFVTADPNAFASVGGWFFTNISTGKFVAAGMLGAAVVDSRPLHFPGAFLASGVFDHMGIISQRKKQLWGKLLVDECGFDVLCYQPK